MHFVLQPWQLCLVALAAWVNRQQREVIEYLITENKVLKEKFGKRRILLNNDQRRRLAAKGKIHVPPRLPPPPRRLSLRGGAGKTPRKHRSLTVGLVTQRPPVTQKTRRVE